MEFYHFIKLDRKDGYQDIEKEFSNTVAGEITKEIDRTILKAALGYKFDNKRITFLDKRYDYPCQRVTLSIHTEITPYKIQEVVYECNRSERSYDDYIKNFNKWVKAGYLKKIEGDVEYFTEKYKINVNKQ